MQSSEIYRASVGYFLRPIADLLLDPNVTEIMVNGPEDVIVERSGKLQRTNLRFPSDAALLAAVRNIAEYNGRDLDDQHPAMDGRLPDGSRIHVILPPAARQGITVTIRRFQRRDFSLEALTAAGTLSHEAAELLSIFVKLKKNIVISGGTGSGKTSLLNALSACIPREERVITIEDTAELQLAAGGHTISLEARPASGTEEGTLTIRELFANSLRMRPDRIIVGEIRRGEALDLVQSMLAGHAGSLSTLHANSPRDALIRLETMCLLGDTQLPIFVARQQVASAVHLVVQICRSSDGRRRVTAISECCGLDQHHEGGRYLWNDLFRVRSNKRLSSEEKNEDLEYTGCEVFCRHELQDLAGSVQYTREAWGLPV